MVIIIAKIKVAAWFILMRSFSFMKNSLRIVGEALGNPDFWAKILMGFAILSAFASIVFASLWLTTSWYTPYENYRGIEEIITKDGQYLRVEYPKRVLANNKPANLVLTLNGEISADSSINFIIPNEVRIFGNQDKAAKIKLTRIFSKSDANPRSIKVVIVNSKMIKEGWWWYSNKIIEISSSDLSFDTIYLPLQMETAGWAATREFVNSSVGDKSPLILLASGLISWAGTYLLQFIKDRREREKEIEQRLKEDRKKYEEDLLNAFPRNPVSAINAFVSDCKSKNKNPDDFKSVYKKLEINGCHSLVTEKILTFWKTKSSIESKSAIEDLLYLYDIPPAADGDKDKNNFDVPRKFVSQAQIMHKVQQMAFSQENTEIDFQAILEAFDSWGESVKSVLIPVIVKSVELPENLPAMKNAFGFKDSPGLYLLRDAKIEGKLAWYWAEPDRLFTKTEAVSLGDEKQKVKEDRLESARTLFGLLKMEIKWKPLRKPKEAEISPRMGIWIISNSQDITSFSFGEYLAELDSFDKKWDYPDLKQIGQSKPLLLFGGEGMGKTFAAYNLLKVHTKPGEYTPIFPVYVAFQDSVMDTREWLVASIAHAIIDFISENPRHFLDAESVQQIAMGRLMLFYEGTVDKLRVALKRSDRTSDDDWSQMLVHLKKVIHQPLPRKKMKDADLMDLLYNAIPLGFNRVFFIFDVSNMSIPIQKINLIKELGHLILPLIQVGVFIKAFMPLEFKPNFDKTLIDSFGAELKWNNQLLVEMLNLRFDKFPALCDTRRTVKYPFELIAAAASGSPRKAIQYGNALMRYAEQNLKDFQKLDANAFENVRKQLINDGILSDDGDMS